MNVTVFGGSSPKEGEAAYQEAYTLGQQLALADHTVLTGGYIGTMEAVSRGANESGGAAIGVTCDEIERFRPIGPNPWVTEERRFASLRERLMCLVEAGDAAFALPGGIGTLAEISMMLNQMQTAAIPTVPLILIGPAWEMTFKTFLEGQTEYINPVHATLLHFAPDVETGLSLFVSLTGQ
ncbi:MAG: LOG family protein [Anaerolineae bacterium]|nr:MAG: LOG family protein [Anaerolineae bacterium]